MFNLIGPVSRLQVNTIYLLQPHGRYWNILTLVSEDISSEVPVDRYLSCVWRGQEEEEEEKCGGSRGHHLSLSPEMFTTRWLNTDWRPVCASVPSPHLSRLLSSSDSTPVIYNLQSSTGPFLNNTKLTSYRYYMVSI